MAAGAGHSEVVQLLLENGANTNAKNRRGQTPLELAQGGKQVVITEVLLDALNAEDLANALLSAVQRGDEELIKQILDRGADVNAHDDFGLTALHHAVAAVHKEALAMLLEHGALVDAKDNAGRTPLHYAAGANCGTANPEREYEVEIVRRLLDVGADIDAQDNIGWTPIHYSAFILNAEMVEYLIQKGVDTSVADTRGYTAYSWIQAKASYYEGISQFARSRREEWQEHIQKYRTVLRLLHDAPVCYYVATDGTDTNPGTLKQPFRTLRAAIDVAEPGDTILIRGGNYHCPSTIQIDKSGERGWPIRCAACDGETPILDFSHAKGDSILITGAYWHVEGLTVKGGFRGAISLYGDKACCNVLEQIQVFDNRYAGIRIEAGAAFNILLNCDSYRNFDLEWNGEDSDGFGAYWDVGPGNVLIGNRAWDNSDDGYDLWDAGGSVRIENCYAFENGENIWNHPFFSGNRNGFKCGRGTGRHLLIRCLSWGHSLSGATLNGNTSGVILRNCTFWDNETNCSFNWRGWDSEARRNSVFVNNISLGGHRQDGIDSEARSQNNTWDSTINVQLRDNDFLSLDDNKMSAPRNPDGSIPYNNFLRVAPGSAAIDAGTDVNMPYVGKAPDLGAFEYDPNEKAENYVKMLHQYVRDHDIDKINEVLDAGTDINDKDWLGYTPLHWAVYFGYGDLIELLVSRGADPDIQSDTGRYALEIARSMAYPELEALLRKLGARAGDASTDKGSVLPVQQVQ